jgi:hypothetical protein
VKIGKIPLQQRSSLKYNNYHPSHGSKKALHGHSEGISTGFCSFLPHLTLNYKRF